MSLVHRCDKCKKIIFGDSGYWNSGETYRLDTLHNAQINKQKVVVEARVYLECGDHLDLCNKCAWNLLKRACK